MKVKRSTQEFKEMVLKEVNETNSVPQVARRHGISPKTIYNWQDKAKHKDWEMTEPSAKKTAVYTPTAQEFKELENENGKLKTILGEKDLEIAVLRDLLKKVQPGYRIK